MDGSSRTIRIAQFQIEYLDWTTAAVSYALRVGKKMRNYLDTIRISAHKTTRPII